MTPWGRVIVMADRHGEYSVWRTLARGWKFQIKSSNRNQIHQMGWIFLLQRQNITFINTPRNDEGCPGVGGSAA